MKSLNQVLKELGLPSITETLEHCDVQLTEQERENALNFAENNLRQRYIRSMTEKGLESFKIDQKVALIDWRARVKVEKVLNNAAWRKKWDIEVAQENAERKAKEKAEKEALRQKHTAGYFYKLIKRYFDLHTENGFEYDSDNEFSIKSICYFLSYDDRFSTELGLNPKKGLLYAGAPGRGKTQLMTAVCQNEFNPISIYNVNKITTYVKEKGHMVEFDPSTIILLDDAGREPEYVNHYGTKINWLAKFIEEQYDKGIFNRIIITTNLNAQQIEDRYGDHVRSRMREMFNIINVKGKDRR